MTKKIRPKLKRRAIKKVVHNVCISYLAADGTPQTIIHQRTEDFEKGELF